MARGTVAVTIWPLAVSPPRLAALHAMLSSDEQTRVAKMRMQAVAQEFIASRGVARELLATRCGCAPADVVFSAGANGKPYLQHPRSGITFSLAHSGGFCALAIGSVASLGVDIEAVRPDVGDLAESIFGLREAAQFAAIPQTAQMEAFFRAWVLKEAYLKATGEGLAGGLQSLELDLAAVSDIRPVAIRGIGAALALWQFHGFDVDDAIVGAVAIDAGGAAVEIEVRHTDAEHGLHRASQTALSP